MNKLVNKLSPSITSMIRADHTAVLHNFHKFQAETSASKKEGIVNTVCLALEIHAQLEEEIFYPALREVTTDNDVLAKSVPEHDEMRRFIEELRGMDATDPGYDATFMDLMRTVMHHVADEETTLLPAAEQVLADQLSTLGAQMTKRRLELAGPRMGELTRNAVKGMPASAMLLTAGGLLAGGYFIKRAMDRRV